VLTILRLYAPSLLYNTLLEPSVHVGSSFRIYRKDLQEVATRGYWWVGIGSMKG
jgi:hypothetical protein